jgi:hypothetical protein
MPGKAFVPAVTPESQLRVLIGRFPAKDQKLIRAVRAAVRRRVPTANELVYDYKSFIVLAYTPGEDPTKGIFSLAARASGLCLYFGQGPKLPDPKKRLRGSGKMVRFIEVKSARDLSQPDVKALMVAAISLAPVPLPAKGRGRLIVRTFGGKRAAPKKTPKGKR